jgi:uncharacterized surface protein with fasciclin (FAS1) repeats
MKKGFCKILFAVVVVATAFSCSKDEAAKPKDNLATVIANNTDLSLFQAAIAKAKLTNFTEGLGPFTMLAPNNAAFNAIGINSAADFDNLDSNYLVSLLAYHILTSSRAAIDLARGPNAPWTTLNSGTLYQAKSETGTLTFNGATVVTPDILASNGVLHVIDRVLFMPSGNAFVNLQANANFKLFVQAINKAAVSSSFTATGPITVFAPTNAAFIAAGLDSTAIANSTAAVLSPIIRYHIYGARLFSVNMKTGTLKMLTGITTLVDGTAKTIKGNTNPAPFNLTTRDLVVTNGVIHTIDGVLKP